MMGTRWPVAMLGVLTAIAVLVPAAPVAAAGDTRVSIGSPPNHYPRNRQEEPALAVDLGEVARGQAPLVLAAGANDFLDQAPCPNAACDIPPGVGVSGVSFSFDGGRSWLQPTYTGWTARTGTARVGPIGTLPKYYEHQLVSNGDPALAFGPRLGANGRFSWANGSRLYYATLVENFPGDKRREQEAFKGEEAIAVSRTDNPRAAASGNAGAWLAPVIVSRQNAALFSDKEAIWADNAATSRFFGNVYICNVAFRGRGAGAPEPVLVARSTDGGATWRQRQISQAANTGSGAGHSGGRQGCTVRTDSAGTVYVVWDGSLNRQGIQYLARSTDGGATFERPRAVAQVAECGQFDPASGDFTFDGVAGARTNSFPSIDLANGAPTGQGATDRIVMTWCDARRGLNHEQALLQTSTDHGVTWSSPVNGAQAGDRPDFPAVAISPDGQDVYLVYDAFLDPWRGTTAAVRRFQGVVRHASGALAGWATLHRAALGDARAAPVRSTEFIGDYNDVVATNDYGAAVWNDARNATLCPAINAYRQALADQPATPPAPPNVATDCPPTWGNSDIYGGHDDDPTP